MTFSISGFTPLDSSSTANVPAPTATQQIHDLASAGESASVIAVSLGVPVSQVDTDLGITTSNSTTETSALVALSGRLSVQA